MIRISLHDLSWRRRRYVIVVVVASLAFGLALTMTGVIHQLEREGRTTVDLFDADHWIVADGVSGPFTGSQLIDRAAGTETAVRSGADAASPLLIGRTAIGDLDVNVVGYDPDSPMLPERILAARAGADDPDGAIVDESLDRAVGESIELGGRDLPVVAQVRGTAFFFSAPTVFLPIGTVQGLLFAGQDVASAIVIRGDVSDIGSDTDLAEAGPGFDVLSNDEVRADFQRVLKSTTDTIGMVNILLWLMAAGIVAAIVFVSVLERTRDFATLKAMGAPDRSLLGGLVVQSTVISIASAAASIAISRAISPTFSFPVSVPGSAYAQLLVTAMLVGVVASLAGVRKITRIDPALAFGGAS